MQTMTEPQRQELEETGELRLLDPATSDRYVAVKEEIYERIKEASEIRATYPALLRVLDMEPDPGLAAYQKYRRKP